MTTSTASQRLQKRHSHRIDASEHSRHNQVANLCATLRRLGHRFPFSLPDGD